MLQISDAKRIRLLVDCSQYTRARIKLSSLHPNVLSHCAIASDTKRPEVLPSSRRVLPFPSEIGHTSSAPLGHSFLFSRDRGSRRADAGGSEISVRYLVPLAPLGKEKLRSERHVGLTGSRKTNLRVRHNATTTVPRVGLAGAASRAESRNTNLAGSEEKFFFLFVCNSSVTRSGRGHCIASLETHSSFLGPIR